jgi:carbon storage regulator CsrA
MVMLVLTRRVGEEIVIDKLIRIRVVRVGGGHARLGFMAPRKVRIIRKEIDNRSRKQSPPGAGTDR